MTRAPTSSGRNFAIGLTILLLIVAVGWLSMVRFSKQTASKVPLYSGTITIGTETWPGYLPLYVARDQGYFKDAGLHVEIKRYVALGELSKDYVAGKMQGRANLTLDMVSEHLQGLDHKAILVIDYSSGSDAIVANAGVPTLKDIRGKRVAFEPGTLEEFFIAWALKQIGFTVADIQVATANPEQAVQQLATGQLDVAVSHEPFLSKMLGTRTFHTLYSSADAPGLITDVLTFRTDFLEAYPDAAQAIVGAYFRALTFWKEHPKQADEILAKEFGDSAEGIAKQLQGMKLLDEVDNRTAFTFAGGLQSLYGNLRQIGEFVLSHQAKTARSLDTDTLIEPRFIRQLVKEESAVR